MWKTSNNEKFCLCTSLFAFVFMFPWHPHQIPEILCTPQPPPYWNIQFYEPSTNPFKKIPRNTFEDTNITGNEALTLLQCTIPNLPACEISLNNFKCEQRLRFKFLHLNYFYVIQHCFLSARYSVIKLQLDVEAQEEKRSSVYWSETFGTTFLAVVFPRSVTPWDDSTILWSSTRSWNTEKITH